MQYELKGIWLIICVILAIVILFKVARKIFKTVLIFALVGVFLIGANVIDVSTISPELQEKVTAVVDVVGESYIKVSGGDVLININDRWCDITKMSVIGDLATESVSIEYEGEKIYVGETGLVNVLRVLDSFGLVHSE